MIDKKRRKALKILGTGSGAAMVLTCMPVISGVSMTEPVEAATAANKIKPLKHSDQIEIYLDVTAQPTVTITNTSNMVAIVRHIHPGIVHAGEHTFDLNSVLQRSAIGIGAGRSRKFTINPTYSTQGERHYSGLKRPEPQQLARLTGANSSGQIINSSRSFYS